MTEQTSVPEQLNPTPEIAFLPINLTKVAGHVLVRVDSALLSKLIAFPWRTLKSARVFRQWYDLANSRRTSKTVISYRCLAHDILNVPARTPFIFVSGDQLDFRLQNLKVAEAKSLNGAEAQNTPDVVAPGESFRHLPEFIAASNYRMLARDDLKARFRVGAKGKLTDAQVVELLNDVRNNVGRMLTVPLTEIARNYFPVFNVKLTPTQITGLLSGTLRHQRGYDYAGLAKLRPTTAQRTLARLECQRNPGELLDPSELERYKANQLFN